MSSKRSLGWKKDLRDIRDLYEDDEKIIPLVRSTSATLTLALPASRHLDVNFLPKPYDQGNLGSCTAHAAAAMISYYQNKVFGKRIAPSRKFIYKITRRLAGDIGDTGATIRDTMRALVLCGAPPESYFPYDIRNFDDDFDAFAYSLAQNYQAVKYYRLDKEDPKNTLLALKRSIVAGRPFMFGFSVYDNVNDATGEFPYPTNADRLLGGHAVLGIGYDDELVVNGSYTTKGAFYIQNSWGESWGRNGIGILPYKYVLDRLADDFWSLVSQEWSDLGAY